MPNFNNALRLLLLALLYAASQIAAAQASRPLNDTGVTFCGTAQTLNYSPCLGVEPVGQDAHYGRDAQAAAGQLSKTGGGEGGFDFTALNSAGQPTTPSSGASPHPCVRDNVTGLVWEVKTDDGGLRDQNWTYTWFDSVHNYGNSAGSASGTTNCKTTGYCDTQKYVADVNVAGLCGFNDWRMPTRLELQSIVHAGRMVPAIDTAYFPNTPSAFFWSASPVANHSEAAWGVYFNTGNASYVPRGDGHSVRLVRGGQ